MQSAIVIDAVGPNVNQQITPSIEKAAVSRLDAPQGFWNMIWCISGAKCMFMIYDFYVTNNVFGALEIISLAFMISFGILRTFSLMTVLLVWSFAIAIVFGIGVGGSGSTTDFYHRSGVISIFSYQVVLNLVVIIVGMIVLANGDIQQMAKSDPVLPYARVTIRRMSEVLGSVPPLPVLRKSGALSASQNTQDTEVSAVEFQHVDTMTEAGHARQMMLDSALEGSLQESQASDLIFNGKKEKLEVGDATNIDKALINSPAIFHLADSHGTLNSVDTALHFAPSSRLNEGDVELENDKFDENVTSATAAAVSPQATKLSICIASHKGLPWKNDVEPEYIPRSYSSALAEISLNSPNIYGVDKKNKNASASQALKVEYARAETHVIDKNNSEASSQHPIQQYVDGEQDDFNNYNNNNNNASSSVSTVKMTDLVHGQISKFSAENSYKLGSISIQPTVQKNKPFENVTSVSPGQNTIRQPVVATPAIPDDEETMIEHTYREHQEDGITSRMKTIHQSSERPMSIKNPSVSVIQPQQQVVPFINQKKTTSSVSQSSSVGVRLAAPVDLFAVNSKTKNVEKQVTTTAVNATASELVSSVQKMPTPLPTPNSVLLNPSVINNNSNNNINTLGASGVGSNSGLPVVGAPGLSVPVLAGSFSGSTNNVRRARRIL